MSCNKCGAVLDHEPSICKSCDSESTAESSVITASWSNSRPSSRSDSRSRLKVVLVSIAVLGLIGAAVGFFVFTGLNGARNTSEANQAAIKLLKQSPAAASALGEIKDIGWPYGDLQPDFATLYMSVKGTKTSGNYFASLKRQNGQWLLVSGRVELSDGTSIDIKQST